MRQTIKISSFQLITIMTNFLLGGSVLVGFAKKANQDAWIAVLLATVCGIMMFLLYCYLFYWKDSKTFVEVLRFSFGKYLGMLISYAYILYFLIHSALVVVYFSYLIQSTLLASKSLWFLSFTFLLVMIFACYLGLEALARTSEILFFVFIGFVMLAIFLAFVNSQVKLNNVLPILEIGWIKMLKIIFPKEITSHFGELIACSTLFSYVKKNENFPLKGAISILLMGCVGSIGLFITIGIIGPHLIRDSVYPFIEAFKKIYILDIIQRFDISGVIMFMIGGFIKGTVHILAAIILFTNLHPKISKKPVMICFAVIVLSISINLSKEFSYFTFIQLEKVPYYLNIPFQIVIPIIIALIIFIRKLFSIYNLKNT